MEFVQVEPGRFELVAGTQSVTALKGLMRKLASPVPIEAMNEVIAAHGQRRAEGYSARSFATWYQLGRSMVVGEFVQRYNAQ